MFDRPTGLLRLIAAYKTDFVAYQVCAVSLLGITNLGNISALN